MLSTQDIKNLENGLYEGKNEDGQKVIVLRQQGSGWTIKTLNSKGWYEVVYYDEDGYREGETVEKALAAE